MVQWVLYIGRMYKVMYKVLYNVIYKVLYRVMYRVMYKVGATVQPRAAEQGGRDKTTQLG